MVKTRVHDLAAEFGVAAEQLLGMLKDMNIFVRSHLSALEHDQVSAVRVRWEREKRKSAEEPAAQEGADVEGGQGRRACAGTGRGQAVQAPAHRRRSRPGRGAGASRESRPKLAALELERPVLAETEEPAYRALARGARPRAVQGSAAGPCRDRGREPATSPASRRVSASSGAPPSDGTGSRHARPSFRRGFSVPPPAAAARPEARIQQQRAHAGAAALRSPESSRCAEPRSGYARSRRRTGSNLRARCREGWRPQEGQEG